MIDIRKQPDLIDRVNDILNDNGIVEIKMEKTGLKVIEQRRVLAYPNPQWIPIHRQGKQVEYR